MKRIAAAALLAVALAAPGQADDVIDAIDAAMAAYDAGNIEEALDELAYAQQLLNEKKTESLSTFLPEAPEGWTREVDTEMAAGMAILGGGVGAEATYTMGDDSFTITMMADNPMVTAAGGMLGNLGLLAGVRRVRINGEKFMVQDGELTGLIDNRVLIQSSGAEKDVMVSILELIDFDDLAQFGQ